jgi:DNA-binding IclR family transcriptional regulator
MRETAVRKAKGHPEYAVPALDRGLDLLEALSASATPQSLTDLARTLNNTPSGLFRLLTRLGTRGYVERDSSTNRYSLTLKLFELSHTHSPLESLVRAAAPPMRELAESVEESVHLSVLTRGRLLVLLDVGSPSKVRISIEAGSQFDPVATNSGRLLLAHLEPGELDSSLARDSEYGGFTDGQKADFHRVLTKIRQRGYALTRSDDRAGLQDISVLVGNPAIGQASALAVACLRPRNREQIIQLVNALGDCARRITLAQGLTYERRPIL